MWGYSTNLMLYDDPWKIKKVLEHSDVNRLSRLLLDKKLVEDLVLPVLDANDADLVKGIQVKIYDIETNSMYFLKLKRWACGSYVFNDGWIKDFVARRSLQKGDEIGLHWDQYNRHFNFSVLRAYQDQH
ncbi:B3 domain-containing protein [Trifolium repens]|nr:B3 domain-containing protein [Trifolium repens]